MEKKNYFITGGTGSLAKKLVEQLIKKKLAKKITIFSRDEYKQSNMLNLPFVKKNLSIFRFFIGDIRDLPRLDWALSSYDDVVVHTAALKQVPVTEYNPFETVKTNIMGTQNLIEVCIKKNINKIILASTDKAVSPINLYGSTKLTAEKLFISANLFKGKNKCKFSVARYGNVMGSRGSIIPILIKQNSFEKYFTITNKNMTRFSLTLNDAANFILHAIHKMKGSEIFVPKISSYRILDIAKAINPKKKIKYIGIRSGEKLHEELINSSEFLKSKENSKEFILYPLDKNIKNDAIYKSSYNSYDNKKYLDVNKIKELIKNNISDFDL